MTSRSIRLETINLVGNPASEVIRSQMREELGRLVLDAMGLGAGGE